MAFTNEEVAEVWSKGIIIAGQNPAHWRKDQCGAWIGLQFYGNRDSEYGWEIDHIDPDGGDNISNLRPLQWTNNAERQEGRLSCPVMANGVRNVRR